MIEAMRQAFQKKIKELDSDGLNSLMCNLLRAESCVNDARSPSSQEKINTPDGGCDCLTFPPAEGGRIRWLGDKKICWQFKSGANFSSKKFNEEINKEKPREILIDGGCYALCLSGYSGNLEDRFLKELPNEFLKYKDNIKIYGMENIADFCTDHPVTVLNALDFQDWLSFKTIKEISKWDVGNEHSENKVPWTENEKRTEWKNDIIDSFEGNATRHIHIFGDPGVGKTRLAIESCKTAPWQERVLYTKITDLSSALKLIRDFHSTDTILVIDDVRDKESLQRMAEEVNGENSRVKLLTIGFRRNASSHLTKLIEITLLGKQDIEKIVLGWHPYENPNFHRYVAYLAEGYVRFARMVVDAIQEERKKGRAALSPEELLNKSNITDFLNKLIGNDETDRRALHICSMLTYFGYQNQYAKEKKIIEGKIISNKFDMKWSDFVSKIEYFINKKIVQRTENYLYISPKLLAIYLAKEAHNSCGKISDGNYIFDLLNELPSEAKKRYCDRIADVSRSIPNFAKEQLSCFRKVGDFFAESNCSLWRALSLADPQRAVSVLKTILSNASLEEKLQIKNEARSILVSTLSHYADFENFLEDSMLALAELAVAENASWANNATGEFRNKFQFFGQSHEQYSKHFLLLDNILQNDNDDYIKIVILALDSSIATMTTGDIAWKGGQLKPDEDPVARDYLLFALEKINEFLTRIINGINNNNNNDLKPPFISLLSHVAYLFRYKTLQTAGERIFENLSPLKKTMREDIRKTLFTSAEWIRKFGNATAKEIKLVEDLHSQFKDTSLNGRLREAIVDYRGYSVNEDTPEAIKKIAQEVFADNDLQTLEEEWAWLTSREAQQAGYLGAELARLDEKNLLSEHLPQFPNRGENWLLLLNYYREKNSLLGDQWLNNWMLTYAEQNTEDHRLPLAVAMYGQGSDNKARFVMRLLSEGIEPRNFPWLVNIIGFWPKGLSYEVAKLFIEFLASKNKYRAIALEFLFYRLMDFSGEESHLPTPAKKETILDYEDIALTLVTDVKILRQEYEQRSGIIVYEWQEVSEMLIKKSPKHANKIVETIFSACLPEIVEGKLSNTNDSFVFHSSGYVAKVLIICAEKDNNSIWQFLAPYLESKDYRSHAIHIWYYDFHNIFNKYLDPPIILEWIESCPNKKNERINMITSLISKNFNYPNLLKNTIPEAPEDTSYNSYAINALNEDLLTVKMLENYYENVCSEFYNNLTTWTIVSSFVTLTDNVMSKLKEVEKKTNNDVITKFITQSLSELKERKKREKKREKEEKLLYGF